MDLKEEYTKTFLRAAGLETDQDTIKTCRSKWWHNLRSKKTGGLRLTSEALEFVIEQAEIKTYEVPIPKEIKISPQIYIWLDQFINSPWHITKTDITVLSEKAAFELYLFSGDVQKLGQSKAMAKRLQSDLCDLK